MPKFLEDIPTSDDKLGKTHKKLAITLEDIIDNLSENQSIKNIIGLFGDWGSGKSSIIKMIKYKKDKYEIFEFDSWSHKDEFLKRAFLIELARKTNIFKEKITEKDNLEKYKDFKVGEVLNNNIKKQIIINKNKIEVNGLTIGVFLISLFSILFSVIGINLNDIFQKIFPITFLKQLFYYIIPINYIHIVGMISLGLIILFLIIILFCIPYGKLLKYLKEELNQLFNYLVLKRIDLEENKVKTEGIDFTNFDYQELFKLIVKKYFENEDKKLIIVLDNLDRVDDTIVLNSISLIQATIEGIKEESENLNKNEKNIFCNLIFILPIDKGRLKEVFEKLIQINDSNKKDDIKENFTEGFIDKTFSVVVDIPKLEQTDWRTFFKDKISKSFTKKELGDIEINNLISVFYSYIKKSDKDVTPREIINFINELVSNYFYWNDEIIFKNQFYYIILKRYLWNDFNSYFQKNKDEIDEGLVDLDKESSRLNYYTQVINFDNYNIIEQKYKTKDITNIIHLHGMEISFGLGEDENVKEKLDKNISKTNKQTLFQDLFDIILGGTTTNINYFGNVLKIIYKLNDEVLNLYKTRVLDKIGTNIDILGDGTFKEHFVNKIDDNGLEGITYMINDKDLKNNYSKPLAESLIKLIVLSNKPKKEDG